MKVKLYRDSDSTYGGVRHPIFYRRMRKGNKATWERCWFHLNAEKYFWNGHPNPFEPFKTEEERRWYIRPSSDLEFVLLVGHAPDQVEKI